MSIDIKAIHNIYCYVYILSIFVVKSIQVEIVGKAGL